MDVKVLCKPCGGVPFGKDYCYCSKWADILEEKSSINLEHHRDGRLAGSPVGPDFLSELSRDPSGIAKSTAQEGSHWKPEDNVFPDCLVCMSVATLTTFCRGMRQLGWTMNTRTLMAGRPGLKPIPATP